MLVLLFATCAVYGLTRALCRWRARPFKGLASFGLTVAGAFLTVVLYLFTESTLILIAEHRGAGFDPRVFEALIRNSMLGLFFGAIATRSALKSLQDADETPDEPRADTAERPVPAVTP